MLPWECCPRLWQLTTVAVVVDTVTGGGQLHSVQSWLRHLGGEARINPVMLHDVRSWKSSCMGESPFEHHTWPSLLTVNHILNTTSEGRHTPSIEFWTQQLTVTTHCQSHFEHNNWRSPITVNRISNTTTSSHYSLTVTFRIWQLTATIYFDHHKWVASLDRCQSHFDHNNWQAPAERKMN